MKFMTNLSNLITPQTAAEGLAQRWSGPAHLRLIIQPAIAIILGIRDGMLDAKANNPPYLYLLLFDKARRRESLKQGLQSISKPLLIGIIMDAIVQYLIFKQIRIVVAILVGGLLVGLPYGLARAITNRLVRHRYAAAAKAHA